MSFIMIAAGPTSCSRVRTVSIRSLLVAGSVLAAMLFTAGAGLGQWLSWQSAAASAPATSAQPTAAAPHGVAGFAAEQLGALSGRLFKLESQASQLIERIGAMQGATAKDKPASRSAAKPGSGGPMLPPRLESESPGDFAALEARLVELEQQIAVASDAAAVQNLALMRLPSRLPVDADVVSGFGNREDPLTGRHAFHAGLDFAADKGTAIHAAAGGTVAFAGFHHDFGWVIEIEHGNGLTTRYAHASRLFVKTGAVVMPGDTIAAVGSTGRSTGPHLHFEVLRNGAATDPRHYLAGL
jgi:murein DD-endopeptidase MepM/ murein hydrolase activator NlpD